MPLVFGTPGAILVAQKRRRKRNIYSVTEEPVLQKIADEQEEDVAEISDGDLSEHL